MIHIFFPLLVSPERAGVQLSKQEKQDFYEMGLHPTMDELDPFGISDWPPTYDTEAFRAQKHSGLMSYQTKMIPDWQVPNLSEKLRTVLTDNHVDWAEGFFFLHTIRGTKQSTRHAKNAEAAQQALEEFFDEANIPMESSQEGEWWVDVGLEFSSGTAACLQWRTSSHVHIVKEVLGIEEGPARRITSLGSSKYSRDLVSHLTAVSGCRIEPGTQAKGDFHATYFQMYTTDKSITYNPEGIHHGKFLPMKSAMGDIQPVKFLESLFNAYSSAIEKNASNARVEVRVPLAHATSVLLSYRLDVVRESLLSFTRGDWW
jgi:hypothetical protein